MLGKGLSSSDLDESDTTDFNVVIRHMLYPDSLPRPGLEVMNIEFILKLKTQKKKRNDWLLVDTCPQATNHCTLFWVWDWTQVL